MGDHATSRTDHELDRHEQIARQRTHLKTRHASALAKLMDERDDLHGVHALADIVSDSLRWSA